MNINVHKNELAQIQQFCNLRALIMLPCTKFQQFHWDITLKSLFTSMETSDN